MSFKAIELADPELTGKDSCASSYRDFGASPIGFELDIF